MTAVVMRRSGEEVARDGGAGGARAAARSAAGRYDSAGYRDMLRLAKRWPNRTWAVEGAGGVGVQLAQRLVADGDMVIDVPPKLSTRARIFDVGHGRRTTRPTPAPSPSSPCGPATCAAS